MLVAFALLVFVSVLVDADEPMPYQFSYEVAATDYGTYLGHQESKNNAGETTGSYYHLAPDGQWHQTFYNDRGSGFQVQTKLSDYENPPAQATGTTRQQIVFGSSKLQPYQNRVVSSNYAPPNVQFNEESDEDDGSDEREVERPISNYRVPQNTRNRGSQLSGQSSGQPSGQLSGQSSGQLSGVGNTVPQRTENENRQPFNQFSGTDIEGDTNRAAGIDKLSRLIKIGGLNGGDGNRAFIVIGGPEEVDHISKLGGPSGSVTLGGPSDPRKFEFVTSNVLERLKAANAGINRKISAQKRPLSSQTNAGFAQVTTNSGFNKNAFGNKVQTVPSNAITSNSFGSNRNLNEFAQTLGLQNSGDLHQFNSLVNDFNKNGAAVFLNSQQATQQQQQQTVGQQRQQQAVAVQQQQLQAAQQQRQQKAIEQQQAAQQQKLQAEKQQRQQQALEQQRQQQLQQQAIEQQLQQQALEKQQQQQAAQLQQQALEQQRQQQAVQQQKLQAEKQQRQQQAIEQQLQQRAIEQQLQQQAIEQQLQQQSIEQQKQAIEQQLQQQAIEQQLQQQAIEQQQQAIEQQLQQQAIEQQLQQQAIEQQRQRQQQQQAAQQQQPRNPVNNFASRAPVAAPLVSTSPFNANRESVGGTNRVNANVNNVFRSGITNSNNAEAVGFNTALNRGQFNQAVTGQQQQIQDISRRPSSASLNNQAQINQQHSIQNTFSQGRAPVTHFGAAHQSGHNNLGDIRLIDATPEGLNDINNLQPGQFELSNAHQLNRGQVESANNQFGINSANQVNQDQAQFNNRNQAIQAQLRLTQESQALQAQQQFNQKQAGFNTEHQVSHGEEHFNTRGQVLPAQLRLTQLNQGQEQFNQRNQVHQEQLGFNNENQVNHGQENFNNINQQHQREFGFNNENQLHQEQFRFNNENQLHQEQFRFNNENQVNQGVEHFNNINQQHQGQFGLSAENQVSHAQEQFNNQNQQLQGQFGFSAENQVNHVQENFNNQNQQHQGQFGFSAENQVSHGQENFNNQNQQHQGQFGFSAENQVSHAQENFNNQNQQHQGQFGFSAENQVNHAQEQFNTQNQQHQGQFGFSAENQISHAQENFNNQNQQHQGQFGFSTKNQVNHAQEQSNNQNQEEQRHLKQAQAAFNQATQGKTKFVKRNPLIPNQVRLNAGFRQSNAPQQHTVNSKSQRTGNNLGSLEFANPADIRPSALPGVDANRVKGEFFNKDGHRVIFLQNNDPTKSPSADEIRNLLASKNINNFDPTIKNIRLPLQNTGSALKTAPALQNTVSSVRRPFPPQPINSPADLPLSSLIPKNLDLGPNVNSIRTFVIADGPNGSQRLQPISANGLASNRNFAFNPLASQRLTRSSQDDESDAVNDEGKKQIIKIMESKDELSIKKE